MKLFLGFSGYLPLLKKLFRTVRLSINFILIPWSINMVSIFWNRKILVVKFKFQLYIFPAFPFLNKPNAVKHIETTDF